MQDIANPRGKIKAPGAPPHMLRNRNQEQRAAGILRAIEIIEGDDTLSDFQTDVVVSILADALTPETGGVW